MQKLPEQSYFFGLQVVLVILFFALFGTLTAGNIFAQGNSASVAIPVVLDQENVPEGTLICSTDSGYNICDKEYSVSLFGIATKTPSAFYDIEGVDNETYVLTSGLGRVRVKGASLSEGNFLTSSNEAGVAQKSERSGYVLGTAMEPYEAGENGGEGLILISIDIHPENSVSGSKGNNILELLKGGFTEILFKPLDSLRYFFAFVSTITSFTLGFLYFGRVAKTGVEALGRNPMAGRMIQLALVFNILVTIVIVLTGLAISYLILIL